MALLAEAIAFLKRGVKIFPLPLGEKRPNNSFPELATDDPSKIALLWRDPITGSRDLNIGVLCGSGGNGIIIVDIDTKHDAKFKHSALANWLAIGGHIETLTVKTASGGLQLYFRLPAGMTFANMQGLVPCVDIRCENGYGIAPGSFAMTGGAYELYRDLPIAELPEAILGLLRPVRERKERLNGHADSAKAIPLFTDYLRNVAPAIEGQGGDTHTYNVACMGVRDYGLSEPTTTNLMLEYFNPRCQPPWDPEELKRKVENAEAYAIGNTGSRDPDKILDGVTYTPATITTPKLIYREDTEDTLLEPGSIPLTDWLVYPMLVKREVTMVNGPGGVGKSAWLIALACHAVLGRDFGPYAIPKPFDVMLYNPEDSRAIISGRAEVACTTNNLDFTLVRERLKVFSQNSKPLVLVEMYDRKMRIPDETIRFLSEFKNRHPNCFVMIFDPLRKMLRGIDENSNPQMSEAMGHANAIAYTLEVSVVLPHHTVKNLMQRKDLDPDSPDIGVGAGSVASSARMSVNLLPQTQADILTQGHNDDYFSTRVSKNNSGPRGQVVWWERRIIRASNGQGYPTPVQMNVKDAMNAINASYIATIGDHMMTHQLNALGVTQAAIVVTDASAFSDRSVKSMAEALRLIFHRGNITQPYTSPNGQRYTMVLDVEGKVHQFTLVEVAGGALAPPMILAPTEETNGQL